MNISQTTPLDVDLFEEFRKLYFDDYEYLAPDHESKEKNKLDFLDGKIENPTFTYSKLFSFDFEEKVKNFQRLKEKAEKHENSTVQKAYTERINEMMTQISMLKAARDGEDGEFTKYSEIIYGNPSPEMFEYDKLSVTRILEKAKSSGDQKRINAAYKLETLIGDLSYDRSIEEKFSLLPSLVEDDGNILSASEIKSLFEKSLEKNGIHTWRVIIDKKAGKSNFSANQEEKIIHIPSNEYLTKRRVRTTKNNIRALIAHEMTHVKRRENGEKSKLKLLGLGLDNFLKGGEGIATYEYQQIEGAKDFAAFRGHFSISLAIGLDGKTRNFRQVFEILKQYIIASSDIQDGIEERAQNVAWNTCIRCFRGTTCKTPGAVFTKGHIYREGNIGIYELIASGSKEVNRFMCGKYDPTNPHHIKILDALGI